jgi:hypothetical protein
LKTTPPTEVQDAEKCGIFKIFFFFGLIEIIYEAMKLKSMEEKPWKCTNCDIFKPFAKRSTSPGPPSNATFPSPP